MGRFYLTYSGPSSLSSAANSGQPLMDRHGPLLFNIQRAIVIFISGQQRPAADGPTSDRFYLTYSGPSSFLSAANSGQPLMDRHGPLLFNIQRAIVTFISGQQRSAADGPTSDRFYLTYSGPSSFLSAANSGQPLMDRHGPLLFNIQRAIVTFISGQQRSAADGPT